MIPRLEVRQLERLSDLLGEWADGHATDGRDKDAASRIRFLIEEEIDERRAASGNVNRRQSERAKDESLRRLAASLREGHQKRLQQKDASTALEDSDG